MLPMMLMSEILGQDCRSHLDNGVEERAAVYGFGFLSDPRWKIYPSCERAAEEMDSTVALT